jgi:hypothetical protein
VWWWRFRDRKVPTTICEIQNRYIRFISNMKVHIESIDVRIDCIFILATSTNSSLHWRCHMGSYSLHSARKVHCKSSVNLCTKHMGLSK